MRAFNARTVWIDPLLAAVFAAACFATSPSWPEGVLWAATLHFLFQGLQRALYYCVPPAAFLMVVTLTLAGSVYAVQMIRQIEPWWILSVLILLKENGFVQTSEVKTASFFQETFKQTFLKTLLFLVFSAALFFFQKNFHPQAFNFQLLVTGTLALLFMMEHPDALKPAPRLDLLRLQKIALDTLSVFLQAALVLWTAQILFKKQGYFHLWEWLPLFVLPLSFLVTSSFKGKRAHFVIVFALSAILWVQSGNTQAAEQAEILFSWMLMIGVLQLAGVGIFQRLKFSYPPKWISSFSIFLVFFAVLLGSLGAIVRTSLVLPRFDLNQNETREVVSSILNVQ